MRLLIPDDAIVVLGNFYYCNLLKNIPKLHQFVTFPTRGNNTLDYCYSNLSNTYSAIPKPHFSKLDHLVILLQLIYITMLKANPVTVRIVNIWTGSALADLLGCLEATGINIFKETVSSYINWRISICVPSHIFCGFPNQKP